MPLANLICETYALERTLIVGFLRQVDQRDQRSPTHGREQFRIKVRASAPALQIELD